MATQLDLNDPGTTLAEVVARVRAGKEITLAERGTPVARVPTVPPPMPNPRKSVRGSWKGKAWMADDFKASLPEGVLSEWEK